MSRCIVSCAVGERYEPYGKRLARSLHAQGYVDGLKIWYDAWPPGSPSHHDCHYAFKFHAAAWAISEGFTEILWLDSSCYAKAPLDPIWRMLGLRGIYCVAGDEPLGEWISDQALAHWNLSRDRAMSLTLCGGAIVGLDLNREVARMFIRRWGALAASGLFKTAHSRESPDRMRSLWIEDGTDVGNSQGRVLASDLRVKGHRSDEACFSLLLHELWVSPVRVDTWNLTMGSGYDVPA